MITKLHCIIKTYARQLRGDPTDFCTYRWLVFDGSSKAAPFNPDIVSQRVGAALGDTLTLAKSGVLLFEALYFGALDKGDRIAVSELDSDTVTTGIVVEPPKLALSAARKLVARVGYVTKPNPDVQVWEHDIDNLIDFGLHPSHGCITYWQLRQHIAVGDDIPPFQAFIEKHRHMPLSYSERFVVWPGFDKFRQHDSYGFAHLDTTA